MNKIKVIGLGPGHKDYILPKAVRAVNNSDIIIGAKRNLKSIDLKDKKIFEIKNNLYEIIDFIKDNYITNKIAVIVSGDTGFYSFLRFLKKHFTTELLQVIPGISSMQYMFASIGESWEDAYIGSLHGRENDFVKKVRKYKKVGLLTDKKWTPFKISQELINEEIKDRVIYIGENLSYENEKITKLDIKSVSKNTDYGLCVVVIIHE